LYKKLSSKEPPLAVIAVMPREPGAEIQGQYVATKEPCKETCIFAKEPHSSATEPCICSNPRATALIQNSPAFPQTSLTVLQTNSVTQQSPAFPQKRPVFPQKRQVFPQKSPAFLAMTGPAR